MGDGLALRIQSDIVHWLDLYDGASTTAPGTEMVKVATGGFVPRFGAGRHGADVADVSAREKRPQVRAGTEKRNLFQQERTPVMSVA